MSGRRKKISLKSTVAESPLPPSPSAARDWRSIWPFLALIAATLLAYLPALSGGVLWDDDGHLTRPAIQSLHGLWRIWFDLGATQQYYPLLHSAFWTEHRIWGDATAGYHLVNVFLHATSACLLVLIVRRLALPGAWLAGLLFALHPVTVESVAWMSEQKSTLSGVLCLASALVYLKFDESTPQSIKRRLQYFLALALFLAALASKTVTATLPAALLVILWWRRGRLRLKEDVRPLVPWLVLGAGAGLFTAWVERTYIGANGTAFELPFLNRLLIAGRVPWFYAAKLLWPADLIFMYPHWHIDAAEWWQWLFPLALITLLAALLWLALARGQRGPLAAALLFIGMLFPVLGFLNVYPFRYSYVADHFQYLACLGLLVPLSAVLTKSARRMPAALAILPLVLAALTFQQSRIYLDNETLWRATLARNPDCWMALNNLAGIHAGAARVDDAIAAYQAALRINPNIVEAETSLGNTLFKLPGRQTEALQHLQKALLIDDRYADAHYNLGVALSALPGREVDAARQFEEAIRYGADNAEVRANLGAVLLRIPGRAGDALMRYEEAVDLEPNSAIAHANLALALSHDAAHAAEALAQYQTALKIRPDYPEAHSNLGNLLTRMGRIDDAVREHQEAVRLRPRFAQAHLNLAGTLMHTPGREPAAEAELRAALAINPNLAEAHYNLALMLSDIQGRAPDAVAEYREAVRVRPDYMEAHNNLGNLLSGMPGRQAEALAEYEIALRLDPRSAQTHYNIGDALAQMGRRAEAIAHLEEALREQPGAAPVREKLARLRAGH
jgi:tetratricopeptide (TPR) repeat protein